MKKIMNTVHLAVYRWSVAEWRIRLMQGRPGVVVYLGRYAVYFYFTREEVE